MHAGYSRLCYHKRICLCCIGRFLYGNILIPMLYFQKYFIDYFYLGFAISLKLHVFSNISHYFKVVRTFEHHRQILGSACGLFAFWHSRIFKK